MPRQSRIDTTGALRYIIARGIERHRIFEDDQDRYDFLKNPGLILEQTETACFAWSLISNHLKRSLLLTHLEMEGELKRLNGLSMKNTLGRN